MKMNYMKALTRSENATLFPIPIPILYLFVYFFNEIQNKKAPRNFSHHHTKSPRATME